MEYWRSKFDWRAQEAALNAFPQFRVAKGVHQHQALERDAEGRHFAALEQPELLAGEVQAFFRELR